MALPNPFSSQITVTVVSTTTTIDKYGDSTTTTTTADYPGCLFAPRAEGERSDPRTPAVISGGTVYGPPGMAVDSDDVIALPPGAHLDDAGNPVYDGPAYTVEGEPGVWGGAGVEVAVKRWEQP